MALEFCRLSLSPQAADIQLFPNGDCGSFELEQPDFGGPDLQNPFLEDSINNKIVDYIPDLASKQEFKVNNSNRIFGSSVSPVTLLPIEPTRHHPWLCSLRTRGFRGRHRCGVTLLSGKKASQDFQEHIFSSFKNNFVLSFLLRTYSEYLIKIDFQKNIRCLPAIVLY